MDGADVAKVESLTSIEFTHIKYVCGHKGKPQLYTFIIFGSKLGVPFAVYFNETFAESISQHSDSHDNDIYSWYLKLL